MSDNHDHPAEQRLKDYSRRRREDPAGPGPLHPATRRLLQQQARESYPPPSASQELSHSTPWWKAWIRGPRLVALGGVAVLMIVAVLTLRHGGAPTATQYAQIAPPDSPPPSQPVSPARQIPPAASPPTTAPGRPNLPVQAADEARRRGVVAQLDDPRRPPPLDALMTPPAPSPARDKDGGANPPSGRAEIALFAKEQTAPAPVQPPAPTPSPALSAPAPTVARAALSASPPSLQQLSDASLADNTTWNLSFEQVPASRASGVALDLTEPSKLGLARAKKSQPSAVLQSFSMSYQNGSVAFQESDGSTYRGSLTPVTVDELAAQQPPQSRALATRGLEAVQGNALNSQAMVSGLYRFQAQGSNRSLRQWVVLQGQLSNAVAGRSSQVLGVVPQSQTVNAPALRDPRAEGWEIQSSVRVGAQSPVNLNARQVAPGASPAVPARKP
ncbi:MAG: hypothetical protein HY299_15980 [Verrucomicrobia bacterium]|nr:hypothetical protein [Verrucomicrobiota bacterium]